MQKLEIHQPVSYDRKDWQRGYESQPQEYNYWIDDVEGEIPSDLQGTFFRNGPGLLDINGQKIHHPFDGDGMVCAIAFANGRAHFCNKFVRTEGYLAEQEAGKILYRGVFGTQKPGGLATNIFDFKIKNIANTNIIYWGGKLLALWEAAAPYRLDPYTLETLGLEYLDGILKPDEPFSAHPRIESRGGKGERLVNFSVKPGLSSTITIYELDADGKLLHRHSHVIPGFAFLHDMAITPNYCIFFQNPVAFNPFPFALGLKGAAECIKFDPNRRTQVILIPRNPNQGKIKVLETEACFAFHHANAWEEAGEIFVDSVCYESFPDVEPGKDFREVNFDSIPAGELWRFRLNLQEETVQHEVIERRCCEFPVLHPDRVGQSYRYLYIGGAEAESGNAPLQVILKIDLTTNERQIWSAAPRGFVGEPVFVPRNSFESEDDGWLIILMYDAANHRSDVVILDALDITKGPVARLHLKHHVPYGLHGSFTSMELTQNYQ
ncbi:carotenoid oxygenase family protein [Kamptonema animale CS-326]|jgi:all-trans-8'-apo-beta-carotenal 15,15'-oxygenase|uniref:carotenoid oxygenase family protein n=1 Tax=Kamptonema animale TaxID=92934 RepID=UPI00232CB042|nr:carotenoid oxygenase family protein [Kamptonema animale]MDB9511192.1 carotenoid oxygenase family protein [Kamptonema animale CS-326]